MEKLISELKEDIIKELNLEDVESKDIKDDEPLFGEGLGLDSIDALSIMVILEKKYGIKLSDPEKGRQILFSVRSMAEYITQNR